MSNLLINERPLQVLPQLAVKVGLNEAIILQQFHYWLQKSNNFKNGKKWIYNSYSKWNEQFPFWGRNTIIRTLSSLEKKNLIITANYNRAGFDKTKWYTINYDELNSLEVWANDLPNMGKRTTQNGLMEKPNMGKRTTQNGLMEKPNMGKPIPVDYQETTQKTKQKITADSNNANTADYANVNSSNQLTINNSKIQEFRKVQQAYEGTIGMMSSYVQQDILKWLDDLSGDLVIEAIKRADANNVHNWKYVGGILRSWANNNVKTLEAVKANDTEFNNKKRNTSRISYSKPNNKGASFKPGDYTEMKRMADNGEIPF